MLNKVEICGINTAKLKVLKNEETQALLLRSKAGDRQAREELIAGNLRLVLSVIQKFTNRGENVDDLFQVGCIGLIKAIDNFNTDLDVRFSTYGVPMNIISREEKDWMVLMTRKNALIKAIEAVNSSKLSLKEKEEVIKKLNLCIHELPFSKWSEAAIFDACDQFIEENGRLSLNDFQRACLPSHPTVKNRFGITLREFRDKYYPLQKEDNSPYSCMSREEMKTQFKKQYLSIKPISRIDYDNRRDTSSPCIATILQRTGIKTWKGLLESCDLQRYSKQIKKTQYRSSFTMQYESKLRNL